MSALVSAGLVGAAAGLRSLAPAPFLAGSPLKRGLLGALATGELIADKLPQTPNRTDPAPLAFRLLAGAVCGASITDQHRASAALIGAAGALAGAFAGNYARRALVRKGAPDWACALVEDSIALSTAAWAIHATAKSGNRQAAA